jgi:hypothetical protein
MAQDEFGTARAIYKQRKKLRDKADKLLTGAQPRVRALVESIEVEEQVEPTISTTD